LLKRKGRREIDGQDTSPRRYQTRYSRPPPDKAVNGRRPPWSESSRRKHLNGAATVFIVDDARESRVAISRLLTAADYRVRSFESAERFLEDHDATVPGCLLLAMCLPGLSGLELQRLIVDSPTARPIVFLAGNDDIQGCVLAMKAGAVDVLTKPIYSVRLFGALERAIRCDGVQRGDRAVRGAIQRRFESLTRREQQVMEQIIGGRLNRQIAADLDIGEKTVKVHRGRVMSKMAVRSIPELIHLGARIGVAFEPELCSDTIGLNVLGPRMKMLHSTMRHVRRLEKITEWQTCR
jgi:FixJ family two-component response regulator